MAVVQSAAPMTERWFNYRTALFVHAKTRPRCRPITDVAKVSHMHTRKSTQCSQCQCRKRQSSLQYAVAAAVIDCNEGAESAHLQVQFAMNLCFLCVHSSTVKTIASLWVIIAPNRLQTCSLSAPQAHVHCACFSFSLLYFNLVYLPIYLMVSIIRGRQKVCRQKGFAHKDNWWQKRWAPLVLMQSSTNYLLLSQLDFE